jgi:hypothetical protein
VLQTTSSAQDRTPVTPDVAGTSDVADLSQTEIAQERRVTSLTVMMTNRHESNRWVSFRFSHVSMSTSPRRKRKPQGGEDSAPSSQQSPKKKRQAQNLTPPTLSLTPPAPKTGHVNIQHNPDFLTAALRLPTKYHELEQMFDALDTACNLFFSRKQTLTFSRLIGSMLLDGHNFTVAHLAQIVTICDSIQKNAFTLERRIITSRDSAPGTLQRYCIISLAEARDF